jgi:hypothetical protein
LGATGESMSEEARIRLIDDLSQRQFIVFAGAGIPHESNPPITWKQLLAAFKIAEPELAARDIDKVNESEYPGYAQEIFEALRGEGRESRYYEILREKLQATNARCSIQQLDIIDTARHAVTTNFDESLKNAMVRKLEGRVDTNTVQILPELEQIALNKDYSVSYLHGSTDEKFIVFKTDDYITFYPTQSGNNRGNDNLEQFLRNLYVERTIVFIGVSFNDKCLLDALRIFYSRVKQNDEVGRETKGSYKSKLNNIQHYAFMRKDMGIKAEEKRCRDQGNAGSEEQIEEEIEQERENRRELLAKLKIKVVTYEEHVEWTEWFKEIREKRRKSLEREKGVLSYFEEPKIHGNFFLFLKNLGRWIGKMFKVDR